MYRIIYEIILVQNYHAVQDMFYCSVIGDSLNS